MLRPFIKDVLAVHELSQCIKQLLRDAFPFVAVCGEVSNLKTSNGITYFTLKDEYSQIPVVCFQSDMARFTVDLRAGKAIIVEGKIDVYTKTGRYQLVAKQVRAVGYGYWQQRLEQLKQKLAAEGLFDSERKKPLPILPKHIAVITSREGAALKDFLSILKRKNWAGHVTLFHSLVQGEKASASIIKALKQANKNPSIDLIVLIRGGGSLEDLWCFNEETLVRALAQSKKATITGIGHEIDYTLCDFASDCRVETPTAAAEKIANEYLSYLQQIRNLSGRLNTYTRVQLANFKQRTSTLSQRLTSYSARNKIQNLRHQLRHLQEQLLQLYRKKLYAHQYNFAIYSTRFNCLSVRSHVQAVHKQWQDLSKNLNKFFKKQLASSHQHVEALQTRLHNVSLESQLNKGFIVPLDINTLQPKDIKHFTSDTLVPIRHKSGNYFVQIKSPIQS